MGSVLGTGGTRKPRCDTGRGERSDCVNAGFVAFRCGAKLTDEGRGEYVADGSGMGPSDGDRKRAVSDARKAYLRKLFAVCKFARSVTR